MGVSASNAVRGPAVSRGRARPRAQKPASPQRTLAKGHQVPAGIVAGFPYEPRVVRRTNIIKDIVAGVLKLVYSVPGLPHALEGIGMLITRPTYPNGTPGAAVPPETGSWTFSAVGDFGMGTQMEEDIARQIERSNPQVLLTLGDNVYPTGSFEDYAKNFAPDRFYGKLARTVPIMPSLGNHDIAGNDLRPYFATFPHLQGRPYYTYTKNNAQFFMLDSDQKLSPGSTQGAWLERELAKSKSPWKVVVLHYPVYASHGNFMDVRKALEPVLRRHGVQLVLNGHAHWYERSKAIGGVTYITGGGGGGVPTLPGKPMPPTAAFRASVNQYVQVHVGSRTMVVEARDTKGALVDAVSIPVDAVKQAQDGAAALRATRSRKRRARPQH